MTATRISTTIGATLGLAFIVSINSTPPSFAYSARAQQMCTGDAMRLCSSEIPNISRIIACMRRNKANVSAGCRAVMEQEDPASRPKPVQAAPAEPKPAPAARAEQPAPVRPKPVQTAPVEPKPAAAPPVAQPAVVETVAVEQKPPGPPPAPQPAAPEAKSPQGAPVCTCTEQKQAPVAPPAAIQSQPVQTAAVEQRSAVPAPADAKPVEAKPAPVARPAKVVRHKQKSRQVTVARHRSAEGGGYERYVSMALPIMSLIMSHW